MPAVKVLVREYRLVIGSLVIGSTGFENPIFVNCYYVWHRSSWEKNTFYTYKKVIWKFLTPQRWTLTCSSSFSLWLKKQIHTMRKVSKYGVFSGPYFPVLRPEKTTYLGTFDAVPPSLISSIFVTYPHLAQIILFSFLNMLFGINVPITSENFKENSGLT